MALTEEDILSIVSNELLYATKIRDLESSLNYYLGNPNGNELEGRSQVTSTDVADVIEWMMPQIMESFTQTNEIVIFDAINAEDEKQAELESEFVYNELMKENDGFILLYQFVKDALMQRNGILKVFYDDAANVTQKRYTGLTEDDLAIAAQMPGIEVLKIAETETGYDVLVKETTAAGKIKIVPVSPEDFRYNSDHNSICLRDARFTAHIVRKTASDLLKEGYPSEIVTELAKSLGISDRDYRFSQQGETVRTDYDVQDDSQALIDIVECYMQMDVEGTGISEMQKITAVVDSTDGTSVSTLLSVEPVDTNPWISTTAIIMSHKFQGLSLWDRIKEIQDQMTALLRNTFDNIYLQNNQRLLAVEGQVNLDDLLISRPGGIIRIKREGAVTPLVTQPVGQDSLTMMQYLSTIRTGRAGVTPEGAANETRIGDRIGSQGVQNILTAKEKLVGLIIRVIAETGVKPLCQRIRDLVNQHVDTTKAFKFKGNWEETNPRAWPKRSQSTVRVGAGSGDKTQKIAALQNILQIQQAALQMPGQAMVNPKVIYQTLDELCKASGLNGASRFFVDPTSPDGQQASQQAAQASQAQQQQEQQAQMAQLKAVTDVAQAEVSKAQTAQQNVQLKAQVDMAKNELAQQKQSYEAQLESLRMQIDSQKAALDLEQKTADLQFKYDQLESQTALKILELEKTAEEFEATEDAIEADDERA